MTRKEIGVFREIMEKAEDHLNDAASEANYIDSLCDDTQDKLDRIGSELADAESELSDVRGLEAQINDYLDKARDEYFEMEKILRIHEGKCIEAETKERNAYGGGGIING